jgi:hypothetical protein
MDIEEGFSPIERAATMSIACENRAAFHAAKSSSGNRPEKPYRVGFVICVGEEPLKNPYF